MKSADNSFDKHRRRPRLSELDLLMECFHRSAQRTNSAPMHKIVGFAIGSTRRLSEITRLEWSDYEPQNTRVFVRDMKNPGEKEGNDVWVDLTPEAIAIVESMPRIAKFISPFNPKSISKSFTEACKALEIDDLHFHDLRHEGCSILAERGLSIPQIAKHSGHRDWKSLQRYVEIKGDGTKFDKWKWWDVLFQPESARRERHMRTANLRKKNRF
jgi:integrase